MDDLVRATQSAAFYSGNLGEIHLVLNHTEHGYYDKVELVPSCPRARSDLRTSP